MPVGTRGVQRARARATLNFFFSAPHVPASACAGGVRATAVVSAAVNVICELAAKNPQNYLPLAPQLFKLLTTSTNNWMIIKIIKLVRAR